MLQRLWWCGDVQVALLTLCPAMAANQAGFLCVYFMQRGLHAPHADPTVFSSLDTPTPGSKDTAAAFSGVAQLVLFLSGPPDIAYGKTVAATAAGRPAGTGMSDGTISPGSGDLNRQVNC